MKSKKREKSHNVDTLIVLIFIDDKGTTNSLATTQTLFLVWKFLSFLWRDPSIPKNVGQILVSMQFLKLGGDIVTMH
jgi:hypothetical protein